MAQVAQAIALVMATGKVAATAVVSVYGAGPGSDVSVASGIELIRTCLGEWNRSGMAG
jgi:arginase